MKTLLIWVLSTIWTLADVSKVTVEEAEKLIEDEIQLLDVRTEDEWKDGHLEGAVRVDYLEKDFHKKVLEAIDLKKPVLVYCRSGNRSGKAGKVMENLGFSVIKDLDGGIVAWEAADKKVVK